jgi:5-methylcytosine-specific restriction endonuclease McrA
VSNQKPNTKGTCKHCGETFWFIYRANREHPYCSYECFTRAKTANNPKENPKESGYAQTKDGQWWYFWGGGKHRTRAYEKDCEWCGSTFVVATGRKKQFCSRKCSGQWQANSGVKNCTQPGEASSQWRGGHERYRGPSWGKARREARNRDNYTCQDCGITESELDRRLEVHHIIPFSRFGMDRHREANVLPNLVSLCLRCHRKRDAVRDTLFR